jgi:hypothetical protein
MTNDKAKDFFSSYYEGTLDPGLMQSLESKLESDAKLGGEYRSFARTMDDLAFYQEEEIQVPADLGEKIAQRLDRAIYEQKQKKPFTLAGILKGLAFSGVAALALISAVVTINNRNVESASSNVLPITAKSSSLSTASEGVVYRLVSTDPKVVVILNGAGKEVDRTIVGGDHASVYRSILKNPNPSAAVFTIAVDGDKPLSVVVPGSTRSSERTSAGTLLDCAKALSNVYGVPVMFSGDSPTDKIEWKFENSDVVAAASNALGEKYRVTLLTDDVLQIEQN